MDTLIAEDLLLLLLDDTKGTVRASSYLASALGGAVLVELALAEAVELEEKTSAWRSAKVRPTGAAPQDAAPHDAAPHDPVLTAGLATITEKDRSPQDLVNRLGKGLKETLTDRLVERGLLERREEKVLGVFPRTRWPAADATHEHDVRRQVRAALVEGAQPDPRTGALVALLAAVDQAHRVVDHEGMSSREVKRRAKDIATGDWAAKAVRDAVAATVAAVTTAVTAATAATAAGY
ncbi:hypothetical protein NSZ01_39200 [Nocardioides szechwanensis]|uniref:Golgi phosphoprotein 3 (GPP34) n=1 Tax=Nocardioides szechwanensis TaxID=1005944 RepID=A0A1H0LGJ5_9ACTN|nr:GPP34 family phosphoprotein [Nocardioides szechwanensis]GEP36152.1 hypothetical protein NSZ01_39200 [Nocardioides szechwanensis]SDO67195.1 Golgi phosphoprotein 3 (GPP34) [Nocardioides szechwanensis]